MVIQHSRKARIFRVHHERWLRQSRALGLPLGLALALLPRQFLGPKLLGSYNVLQLEVVLVVRVARRRLFRRSGLLGRGLRRLRLRLLLSHPATFAPFLLLAHVLFNRRFLVLLVLLRGECRHERDFHIALGLRKHGILVVCVVKGTLGRHLVEQGAQAVATRRRFLVVLITRGQVRLEIVFMELALLARARELRSAWIVLVPRQLDARMTQRICLVVQAFVVRHVFGGLVAVLGRPPVFAIGQVHLLRHEAQVKHVRRALHFRAVDLVVYVPSALRAVKRRNGVVVSQTLQLVLAQCILIKLGALLGGLSCGTLGLFAEDGSWRAVDIFALKSLPTEIRHVDTHRANLAMHGLQGHVVIMSLCQRCPCRLGRHNTGKHLEEVHGSDVVPVHIDDRQTARIIAALVVLVALRVRLCIQLCDSLFVEIFLQIDRCIRVVVVPLRLAHGVRATDHDVSTFVVVVLFLLFVVIVLFLTAALQLDFATRIVGIRVEAVQPLEILRLPRVMPLAPEPIELLRPLGQHVLESFIQNHLCVVLPRSMKARIRVHARKASVLFTTHHDGGKQRGTPPLFFLRIRRPMLAATRARDTSDHRSCALDTGSGQTSRW